MALLELKFATENGGEEMVVKDRLTGLAVKEVLKFLSKFENEELDAIDALDEAVNVLVAVYNSPSVNYDRIMNDLIFDGDKGFFNTILEQLYTVTAGKKQAMKIMEAVSE